MRTITAESKEAVQRIQAHPAFMSIEDFDSKFLYTDTPLTMSEFISRNRGLITRRHDWVADNPGQDFLINLMIEMLVLHINEQGDYSLHRWERGKICSDSNRLPKEKERDVLEALLEESSHLR